MSEKLICPYATGHIHCLGKICATYDRANDTCAPLSQIYCLREIAASLAKLSDKQECELTGVPIDVELQSVIKDSSATCGDCIHYDKGRTTPKCFLCSGGFPYKPLFKKKS